MKWRVEAERQSEGNCGNLKHKSSLTIAFAIVVTVQVLTTLNMMSLVMLKVNFMWRQELSFVIVIVMTWRGTPTTSPMPPTNIASHLCICMCMCSGGGYEFGQLMQ
uniref:Transmembrane protein n=1 Tax=Glossina brevipalpis TaxID=37001 RepID=A0A1A9WVU5_9MUSC